MNKIAFISAVFFSGILLTSAFTLPEKPTGYVSDYANILSQATIQLLESDLQNFTASTSNEIAVVTVPDLGGDTVEHYATKLFELWKIGNAKNDNGILLLIARDDHKLRIEVGYGLEGALPDILARDIIDSKITPYFKQGDYDKGVIAGISAIKEATKGEYKATPNHNQKSFNISGNLVEFALVIIFFVFQILASILGRSKSWWAGGLLGGVGGGILTYLQVFGMSLFVGSIVTIALVVLGLIFDYFVSNGYNSAVSSGSSIPWWAGGGSGGSGGYSSSSSFGGFGGGSSGGGGASGSW
jgi:uncharacterized protein